MEVTRIVNCYCYNVAAARSLPLTGCESTREKSQQASNKLQPKRRNETCIWYGLHVTFERCECRHTHTDCDRRDTPTSPTHSALTFVKYSNCSAPAHIHAPLYALTMSAMRCDATMHDSWVKRIRLLIASSAHGCPARRRVNRSSCTMVRSRSLRHTPCSYGLLLASISRRSVVVVSDSGSCSSTVTRDCTIHAYAYAHTVLVHTHTVIIVA